MARWRCVAWIAVGGLAGCRAATAPPEPSAKTSAAHPSAAAAPVDPCRQKTKCLTIGGVERCVPLVNARYPETSKHLNGCTVGIQAGGLSPLQSCTKKLCPTPPDGRPARCCNRCSEGGMAFSTLGTAGLAPLKDGKHFRCPPGMDCEAAQTCEIPPGHYDMVGRLRMVTPERFEIDVEAMQRVNSPNLPPPPRELASPCSFPTERDDALRGWSEYFRVELGGLVVHTKDVETAVGELQLLQHSLRVSMEMVTCDGGLAVWIAATSCPPPPSLLDAFRKVAPVVRTACFKPMTVDENIAACNAGRITPFRCDSTPESPPPGRPLPK